MCVYTLNINLKDGGSSSLSTPIIYRGDLVVVVVVVVVVAVVVQPAHSYAER